MKEGGTFKPHSWISSLLCFTRAPPILWHVLTLWWVHQDSSKWLDKTNKEWWRQDDVTKETDDQRGSRRASVADVVKRCLPTSSLDGESVWEKTTDAERRERVCLHVTLLQMIQWMVKREKCVYLTLIQVDRELSGRQQKSLTVLCNKWSHYSGGSRICW